MTSLPALEFRFGEGISKEQGNNRGARGRVPPAVKICGESEMLKKLRAFADRRAEAAAAREQQRQREAAEAARLRRQREHDALAAEIDALRSHHDLHDEFGPQCPIVAKRGEEILLTVHGAALTETRRAPRTSYSGGSHGLSIRVAKGVYYRPSVHRGKIEAAPEQTTVIDGSDGDGVFVVSNKRAVFRGGLHTREFRWDKLVSVTPERFGQHWMLAMPVENRQRVSGVVVGSEDIADLVMRRVMFGIALHQDRGDAFLARLEADLSDLQADEPPSA